MKKFFKILTILSLAFLFFSLQILHASEKIKIGLLVPMSGDNKQLGYSIIKATRLALNDINDNNIEIIPKDTGSDPNMALRSAIELDQMGIQIVIGPVFHKSLSYLNEVNNIIFLSLTNKTLNISKNVISSGINSTSQLNTIKKFIKLNEIEKTIFLTPNLHYKSEIKKGIEQSKIKIIKHHVYDSEPTKLTEQIEKITNYKSRKQNLSDELLRLENSNEVNKEKIIERLKKKYTLGKLNFDSIIIADFEEGLKSVTTSLLYADVLPKEKYFITLNQWFDESLLNEKSIQPIYFPSINKKNFDDYKKKFFSEFNENPTHLSLLTYDLVGLVYYLSLRTDLSNINKMFSKNNSFKGKIGIFDIKNNKINHQLNFYKIENKKLKKIF